jgi:SAM-dependent methyltransferase
MPALLPDMTGKRVIDLGCGEGWLCRLAADQGASDVLGIDPSTRMLALAGDRTSDPRIHYRQSFVEDTYLAPASVDVVVSILALHYVADLAASLRTAASWLGHGGVFVCILEHPNVTAPLPGRELIEKDGRPFAALLHRYFDEGERREHWFVDDVVKYHRGLATILNSVISAGLTLDRVDEPLPSAEARATNPRSRDDLICPRLLAIRAVAA